MCWSLVRVRYLIDPLLNGIDSFAEFFLRSAQNTGQVLPSKSNVSPSMVQPVTFLAIWILIIRSEAANLV
jgi:hypothetical protein